jgi:hypothetical protein
MESHGTELRQVDSVTVDAREVRTEVECVVPVARPETREAWSLASMNATKERIESVVEPTERAALDPSRDRGPFGVSRTERSQLLLLVIE